MLHFMLISYSYFTIWRQKVKLAGLQEDIGNERELRKYFSTKMLSPICDRLFLRRIQRTILACTHAYDLDTNKYSHIFLTQHVG